MTHHQSRECIVVACRRTCVVAVSSLAVLISVGCRAERVEPKAACTPGTVQDKWTERRTAATGVADTARASLSMTLVAPLDSLDRLPSGATISLVIAGPTGAERPDTVRMLTADVPGGPLWSGSDLRPGAYSASLTTDGFAAGPREFSIAAGEKVEIDVGMGRTCESSAAK